MDKKTFMVFQSPKIIVTIVLWSADPNLCIDRYKASTEPTQHLPCNWPCIMCTIMHYPCTNQSKEIEGWFYFLPSRSSGRGAIGGGSGAHPGKRGERGLWSLASVWSSVSRIALHSCIFQLQEMRAHSAAHNAKSYQHYIDLWSKELLIHSKAPRIRRHVWQR